MTEPAAQWLELSLVVDGELAEAVAEVLSRYAPGGVAVESTGIRDKTEGEGVPKGPLRVAAYLPVDHRLSEVRRQIEEALGHLSAIRPLPTVRTRWIR
ncbi:MAG TPA: 50S ribosomal protein L11 methyltransferase, partial [Anaerolineae bacterium]|nr:50S ribosomal protein L11 methyltransferase [Anaerolineae bacterium]